MQAVAFALRRQGRRRMDTAGELTARIAAERIADRLARVGVVVMHRVLAPVGPDSQYAPHVPSAQITCKP
jgi:hypothetical protein